MANCHYCQSPVRPNSRLTYRRVLGWTRGRKGGGANQITLSELLDIFACDVCIDKLKRNVTPGQMSLLGAEIEQREKRSA